jgi:hypothetical protein
MVTRIFLISIVLALLACRRDELPNFPPSLSAPEADRSSSLYSVEWLDHYFPREVSGGKTALATVSFRNTSDRVWNSWVKLSYSWTPDNPKIKPEHASNRTLLSRPVAPNAVVIMDHVDVKVPDAPGRYRLTFDLVNELVAWFSDRGAPPLSIPVVVR